MRKAISGSMRGSSSRLTGQSSGPLSGSLVATVESYIGPQIGACTPYSSQIVVLVKPIFQPTGLSPRAMRRFTTAAATR